MLNTLTITAENSESLKGRRKQKLFTSILYLNKQASYSKVESTGSAKESPLQVFFFSASCKVSKGSTEQNDRCTGKVSFRSNDGDNRLFVNRYAYVETSVGFSFTNQLHAVVMQMTPCRIENLTNDQKLVSTLQLFNSLI